MVPRARASHNAASSSSRLVAARRVIAAFARRLERGVRDGGARIGVGIYRRRFGSRDGST